MSTTRLEHADVLVVGGGAAGIAAARGAVNAGAGRVVLVSAGAGATEMCAGWIAAGGAAVDVGALAWLAECGLRTPGAYAFVSQSGAVFTAVSGLATLLDLGELPDGGVLGVVDLVAGTTWSADLVARSIQATLGRECTVVDLVRNDAAPRGASAIECARALESSGITEAVGGTLRAAAQGCCALLFPPVLGFVRTDVARRLAEHAGMPVGEVGGGPGDPTALRFARALAGALPAVVERVRGEARVSAGGGGEARVSVGERVFAAGAVVLTTGGLLGGGLRFERGMVEACAGAPVWLGPDELTGAGDHRLPVLSSERGMDPYPLFVPDASGRSTAMGAGVRVRDDARVLGLDGRTEMQPWLFAAGAIVGGGRGATGHGLADVLGAGARAGALAARHAQRGEATPEQPRAEQPLPRVVARG